MAVNGISAALQRFQRGTCKLEDNGTNIRVGSDASSYNGLVEWWVGDVKERQACNELRVAARQRRQQSLLKIGFGAHLRVSHSLIGPHMARRVAVLLPLVLRITPYLATRNTKRCHMQRIMLLNSHNAFASSRLRLTAQHRICADVRYRNRTHFSSCFRRRHSPIAAVVVACSATNLQICWHRVFPKPSCPPFRFICSPSRKAGFVCATTCVCMCVCVHVYALRRYPFPPHMIAFASQPLL